MERWDRSCLEWVKKCKEMKKASIGKFLKVFGRKTAWSPKNFAVGLRYF